MESDAKSVIVYKVGFRELLITWIIHQGRPVEIIEDINVDFFFALKIGLLNFQ